MKNLEEVPKITVVIMAGFTEERVEKKALMLIQVLFSLFWVRVVPIEYLSREEIKNWSRRKERAKIEEMAERIFPQIEAIEGTKIVVAHSMGCLVARYLIEVMDITFEEVILLAGPHKGCKWKYLPVAFIPCVRQMLPGSKFLQKLGEPKGNYWYFSSKNDEKVLASSAIPVINGKIVRDYDCGHNLFEDKEVIRNIRTIVSRFI
jgi:predicted alpha/beta hydrolase family esterase